MKTLKGIGVYTLVIAGILVVIAGLLVGCMFLMPGFKMFGWALLAKNNEVETYVGGNDINSGDYTVNIDASLYDLTITLHDGKKVTVSQNDQMYGFYRPESYKEEDFKTKITQDGHTINIVSPKFDNKVAARKSYLFVKLPQAASNYNLNITTTSGDITITGTHIENKLKEFPLEDLTINTNSGDVKFDKLRSVVVDYTDGFKKIDLTKDNPFKDLKLENVKRYIPFKNILINSNSGDVDFRFSSESLKPENAYLVATSFNNLNSVSSAEGLETLLKNEQKITPIIINSKKSDVTFNNVNAKQFLLNGEDVLLRANNVTSLNEFKFNSPSGLFEIESLDAPMSTITTNNIGIKLGVIKGELSITTTYGNIEIDETLNNTSLNTVHGNIKVKNAKGSVSAITEFGDIDVSYYGKAYFKNERGSIKVNFVNSDLSNLTGVNLDKEYNKTCDIITGKGVVDATNLTYETTITSNGGRINAQFSEMYEASQKEENNIGLVVNHKVILNGGSANIQIPSLKAFMFKGNGNISGEVGSTVMTANKEYSVVVGETGSDLLAHFEVDAKGGNANFSTYWKTTD